MHLSKAIFAALILASMASGQTYVNGPVSLPSANDATTGTTLYGTAVIGPTGAIGATTSSTLQPYIVVGNAGISGNATLAFAGIAACTFDSTIASGAKTFYVVNSTTTNSTCHAQAGAPTTSGVWVIGFLLDSATTTGQTSRVILSPFPISGSANFNVPISAPAVTVTGITNPPGISAFYFNSPSPYCQLNPMGYDQLCDGLDPATGASALFWNPLSSGGVNERLYATAAQSAPYTDGQIMAQNSTLGLPAIVPNVNFNSSTGLLTANGGIHTNVLTVGGLPVTSVVFSGPANAIIYDNGAGGPAGVGCPAVNGVYSLVSNVTASATVPPSCALPGVPVDATNPATLLYSNRSSFLAWTSGSAQAWPTITTGGQFGSNLPFSIYNTAGNTLTFTPNAGAGDLCNGSSTCALLNNWFAFHYQDSTVTPGHHSLIPLLTFAAMGSTCVNGINWSTTAGVGCNSLGVDSGAANAYVVTGTAITSLTATGIIGCFNPSNANSGASTVNINGLGVTAITKFTNAPLILNDIIVGNPACIRFNGSTFTLTNPVQSTGTNKIVLSNGATLANTINTGPLTSGTAGSIGGFIDLGVGFTTVAMSAQTTATCTPITNMTWTIAANKNYDLHCKIPRTLAASATLQYCLGGPGTATSYSLDVQGANGTAGAWIDLNTLAQTAYLTKTTASAAAANTAVDVVDAQIRNGATASGTALTLQTAANGTNAITVLENADCRLIGVN